MKTYNNYTNHKILLGILLPILAFFISMNATFAYFTSSVEIDKSTSQTGTITIKITDDTAWKVNSSSISASTKLIPGDTLTVEGKVENAGSAQFYAVLQLKIDVTKTGETAATTIANKFYSFDNTTLKEIVSTGTDTLNVTAFTVDAPNANKTNTYTKAFSIPYTFDFYQFDNSYKNAKVNYYVYAHAVQTKNINDATKATQMLIGEIIPLEYQQVEYIQSTGTQWIDTGFVPNQDTRVVMDFQAVKNNATFIFGTRTAVQSNSYAFNMGGSGESPDFVTSYASQSTFTIKKADTERHVVDKNKNEVYLDDILVKTFTYQNFSCPASLELLAGYSGNKSPAEGYLPSSTRIYSCQIYDNGTLIRDFVPCFRTSDNVVGLFDKVNNVFYTNSGTGTFKTIPAEYQQVEYIESTGTQWIDTGVFTETSEIKYEGNLEYTTAMSVRQLMGTDNGYYFGINTSGYYEIGTGFETTCKYSSTGFDYIEFYSNPSTTERYLTINNMDTVSRPNTQVVNNSIFLFALNVYSDPQFYCACRIKDFKIYKDGTLVRDFVPCYRISDNEIGLYDRVNNVFYTNSGSGLFLKGANV